MKLSKSVGIVLKHQSWRTKWNNLYSSVLLKLCLDHKSREGRCDLSVEGRVNLIGEIDLRIANLIWADEALLIPEFFRESEAGERR